MSERIHITNVQNNNPLVSICIPVYNAEKTIEKTLHSIVNQSYNNLEIIVVDNLSTDNTQKIVEKFQDSRIRSIQNGVHFDVGEDNWNTCFQHARGEYLALFHSDDIYDPNFVEKEIACFNKHPEIGAVFTSAIFIDENDNCFGEHKLPSQINGEKTLTFNEIFILVLEKWNFFICPSALVKGELYKKLSPFRYEKFRSSSDLDMWLRILEQRPVVILPDTLMRYRITKNSGSYKINNLRTEKADYFKVTEYYLDKYPDIKLSSVTKTKYRYFELIDILMRAKSYIVLKNDYESGKLLYEILKPKYVKPLVLTGHNFEYKKIWLVSFIYLLLLKISPKIFENIPIKF